VGGGRGSLLYAREWDSLACVARRGAHAEPDGDRRWLVDAAAQMSAEARGAVVSLESTTSSERRGLEALCDQLQVRGETKEGEAGCEGFGRAAAGTLSPRSAVLAVRARPLTTFLPPFLPL
jgi:hypothetical protein